jgi:hypothetical protein
VLSSNHLVASNSDGQGLLNTDYRDDQAAVIFLRQQQSFNAIKTPATNSNFLTDLEKGAEEEGKFVPEDALHRLNLFVWDRNSDPSHPDKTDHPVRSKYGYASASFLLDTHEKIVGEEGNLNLNAPVAPLMRFGGDREEDLGADILKPGSNFFLVPRSCPYRKPTVLPLRRLALRREKTFRVSIAQGSAHLSHNCDSFASAFRTASP